MWGADTACNLPGLGHEGKEGSELRTAGQGDPGQTESPGIVSREQG